MITISKTASALQRFFEAMAKARVNSVLLGMGRAKAEELGYSYEALRAGPSAWPWRKTTHDSAATGEIAVTVREPKDLSEIAHPNQPRAGHEFEQDAA
ncbi:MAG: hypothetical protein ACO3DT_08060 [Gammaproteobacteria bacterium]